MTRVALGMTLYNNARHLPEAAGSLLRQTFEDFSLVMLDDASVDDTEPVARSLAKDDARVRYERHPERLGMVPTWQEVFTRARRESPGAEYFAWVSDHDRWAPAWLATLVAELDAHPEAVLAYPMVGRIDDQGQALDKPPRAFDTAGVVDARQRWQRFCWEGFGSGDMVYGLIRVSALERAGVFRPVLNPDRLLIAELNLQGQIRQVQTPLWFRRQAGEASVARQRMTLFAGTTPTGFWAPPAWQHVRVLQAELTRAYGNAPVPSPATRWGMLAEYLLSSGWRAYRKTDTSKRFGRGVDQAHFVKKLAKKLVRTSVYYALVSMHALSARARRIFRRVVYEVAMWTHRTGLRKHRGGTHPR